MPTRRPLRRAWVAAACTATVFVATAFSAAVAQQPTPTPPVDPRTMLDRVFSVPQADRGEGRFKQSCSGCHVATQFAEPSLSARWEGQTLGDLFEYLAKEMPQNDPGGLKPQDYADIIAFFLGQSGFPVGYDELPADLATLKEIQVVPQPK